MDQGSNRQQFAARLGELRRALGLSYNDVGAAVGVSGETIRNYELGRSAPRKKRDVTLLEEALEARTGELWAMLSGYEIPAKHPRRTDPDTDRRLVDEIFRELRELRAAIAELRPGQNGGPPESHRGSRTRVPVPSQRAS
jgi:transcriptional regulator with XRE-family HTH domain